MRRIQIFGDPACMGSDAEVAKELEDMDADEAMAEAECAKLSRRGTKNLMKFN